MLRRDTSFFGMTNERVSVVSLGEAAIEIVVCEGVRGLLFFVMLEASESALYMLSRDTSFLVMTNIVVIHRCNSVFRFSIEIVILTI